MLAGLVTTSMIAAGHDVKVLGRVLAVAIAVGLDVLAISVGVGVTGHGRRTSLRIGAAFATSEIAMQFIGYELGTGATRILGQVADYVSMGLLFLIGALMLGKTFLQQQETHFDASKGIRLLLASLSISLDSLGVGIALPALAIPLVPLLLTVSVTTIIFTLIGLAFGARLGESYERNAERAAGAMLMLFAGSFAIERLL